MGFSHEATKHSFKIYDDGGAIEVRALHADDEASVRAIRTHLQSIAKSFAAGDFANPAAIHGPAPAGFRQGSRPRSTAGWHWSTAWRAARRPAISRPSSGPRSSAPSTRTASVPRDTVPL